MSSSSPVVVIYRELLRACRRFDKMPSFRSALSLHFSPRGGRGLAEACSNFVFDDASPSRGARLSTDSAVEDTSQSVLRAYLGPHGFYRPDKLAAGSLCSFARSAFRQSSGDPAVGLDATLSLIRLLSEVGKGLEVDAAAAAHTLDTKHIEKACGALEEAPALTPGMLLAEHPSILGPPERALLLVYDISRNVKEVHGDEAWSVRCYAVNRPLPGKVATYLQREDLGPFGDLPLFHGGVEHGNISIIHRCPSIEGAMPVEEDPEAPLYIGGSIEAINAALTLGTVKPADFKVVVGSQTLRLIEEPNDEVETAVESSVSGEGDTSTTITTTTTAATGAAAAAAAAAAATTPPAAAAAHTPVTPSLSLEQEDRWFMLSGAGVVDFALHPPIPPPAGMTDEPAAAVYNHARCYHQNMVWSAAMQKLASSTVAAAAGSEAATTASMGDAGDDDNVTISTKRMNKAAANKEEEPRDWMVDASLSQQYAGMARLHPAALRRVYVDGLLPSPILTPLTQRRALQREAALSTANKETEMERNKGETKSKAKPSLLKFN